MAIYRNSTAKNQAVLNRLNNMRYSQLLKQKQYNMYNAYIILGL